MARSVSIELDSPLMEAIESPADEDRVYNSFYELIEEQSQNAGPSTAFELQELQRELDEEGQDDVPYLASPDDIYGRGQEQWDEERPTDSLIRERWSSDTLRILSSMPSRTIGRNKGAIISQYYNRTMQLRRRRQSRPSVRDFSHSSRPSIRGYGIEADSTDAEDSKRARLVNNLQNLSVSDRVRMLQGMPLCLTEKRDLRRLSLQKEQGSTSRGQRPCCSQLKYYIIIAVRQSWYSCLSFLHSLHLWQVALKRVSGRFGTGVLSYFLFLKTLLFFNLFLFFVTGAFLVLPQAVHPPDPHPRRAPFSGLELLSGAGYFSDTVMYYGYYCNYTLHGTCRDHEAHISAANETQLACRSKLSYNMPLAYFFTIGALFFITCIILVYSMSKSFGQSFRVDKSQSILAMKVFCSWDFKVLKKTSVKIMSENICTQIKELLAEVNQKQAKITLCQRLWRLVVHGLAWAICIASTVGCAFGIYFFSEHMHKNLEQLSQSDKKDHILTEASMLALPAVVSVINFFMPALFNAAAWMEDYDSPSMSTYVAISRNLMLKMSVLGVLCYHWLWHVAEKPERIGLQCWENFVGQELYRFLIMDFIFTLLDTLFGEFLWRLFSEKVLKRKRKPVFDIPRNVLDLIYGQALAWLGVLFSPLLPAVQVLKLLVLFYIKKGSVMMNCQAPRKPYRVSQMTTVFITLLCIPSFVGATVCVTYTMWRPGTPNKNSFEDTQIPFSGDHNVAPVKTNIITPSSSCGPFRQLKTMMQAGKQWVEEMESINPNLSVLARAHSYLVEHPFFLFVGAGIFLIVIYFHSQVVDGQRKIVGLLQEHIKNEGEDKKFLITRLQSIHERKRTPARRLTSQDSS